MIAATPGVGPVVLGTVLSLHPNSAPPAYTEVTGMPLFGYTRTFHYTYQNDKPRRRRRSLNNETPTGLGMRTIDDNSAFLYLYAA